MHYEPITEKMIALTDSAWGALQAADRAPLARYFNYGECQHGMLKDILECNVHRMHKYPYGAYLMVTYRAFLGRYAPDCSWGSPGICEEWVKRGGLKGRWEA